MMHTNCVQLLLPSENTARLARIRHTLLRYFLILVLLSIVLGSTSARAGDCGRRSHSITIDEEPYLFAAIEALRRNDKIKTVMEYSGILSTRDLLSIEPDCCCVYRPTINGERSKTLWNVDIEFHCLHANSGRIADFSVLVENSGRVFGFDHIFDEKCLIRSK
jgi:hypothetical protein